MKLGPQDLRVLHIIRALQPVRKADMPKGDFSIDIIRFEKMDLITMLVGGGYALTEKGQTVLRHE